MQSFQKNLIEFFNNLTGYDYAGFLIALILFILFLILALMLRKRTKLAMLLISFSFIALFGGPVGVHALVKHTLYKHEARITDVKKLHYSDTLLIKGDLEYLGDKMASSCVIDVKVHKQEGSFFKDIAHTIKPYKQGSAKLLMQLDKGDSKDFKVVIEPFTYAGDYNITVSSGCF